MPPPPPPTISASEPDVPAGEPKKADNGERDTEPVRTAGRGKVSAGDAVAVERNEPKRDATGRKLNAPMLNRVGDAAMHCAVTLSSTAESVHPGFATSGAQPRAVEFAHHVDDRSDETGTSADPAPTDTRTSRGPPLLPTLTVNALNPAHVAGPLPTHRIDAASHDLLPTQLGTVNEPLGRAQRKLESKRRRRSQGCAI